MYRTLNIKYKNIFILFVLVINLFIYQRAIYAQENININFENPQPLQYRWVWLWDYSRWTEQDKIRSFINKVSEDNINGIVLGDWGFEYIRLNDNKYWPKSHLNFLKSIDSLSTKNNIELIPAFSTESIIRNLHKEWAAATPTQIYVVANKGTLKPIPIDNNLFKDKTLSQFNDNNLEYYSSTKTGKISFIDQNQYKTGSASLRIEYSTESWGAQVNQEIPIEQGKEYKIGAKYKTENMQNENGDFKIYISPLKNGEPVSGAEEIILDKTANSWKSVQGKWVNTNKNADSIRILLGIWGPTQNNGKFWVDSLNVKKYSSLNKIVRRESTPLTITSEDGSFYQEGKDYEKITYQDTLRNINIPNNSKINNGDTLIIDAYKDVKNANRSGICYSQKDSYDFLKERIKHLFKQVGFTKIFLRIDERRTKCNCELCKNKTGGELLGYHLEQLNSIVKDIDSSITIFAWGDMINPYHNGVENYYGFNYSNTWQYIPQSIIPVLWGSKVRTKGINFLTNKGFQVMGAGYYDSSNLNELVKWHNKLISNKNAIGIMYTSWKKKYNLLNEYNKILSGSKN